MSPPRHVPVNRRENHRPGLTGAAGEAKSGPALMRARSSDMARDYNRGLARPVRWVHVALAAAADLAGPVLGWVLHPKRRDWTVPLLVGAAAVAALLPYDGPLSRWLQDFDAGGDLGRELHAWQQVGAPGSLIFTACLIWVLDPARRRRLLDLGAGIAISWAAVAALKVLVGRPRPRAVYDDPWSFLWPWGKYPVVQDGRFVLVHAWEPAAARSADLWSMPSSHTAAAAALAVFLTALYPRIRWIAAALVAVVALCRVHFGAHWPTDVIAGAAIGVALAQVAVARYWGVRALDWFWVKMVNPVPRPALAATLERERARGGLGTSGSTAEGAWGWWFDHLARREAERAAVRQQRLEVRPMPPSGEEAGTVGLGRAKKERRSGVEAVEAAAVAVGGAEGSPE